MRKCFHELCVVAALGVGLIGCADSKLGRMPDPPADPPAPPPMKREGLDSSLQAKAKEELAKDVESNNAIVRANAIEAIQDSVGAEGKDVIVNALSDPNALVRFSAAMAAGTLRLSDARLDVLGLVNDPNAHVRIGVRYALHRLGDTHLSHDLETTSRDFDPHVRADTALVLGLLGEHSALNVLEPMLDDPDPDVRIQVAEAMWRLGSEEGLTNLVAGSVSSYADDQIICLLALAAPKDYRVSENLRGRLTADYPQVALAAARGLGELGSDAGYGVAQSNIKSKDPRIVVMAALALGAIGRADAQPLLSPLLADSDQSVRLAAATAILELKASG
jgi:HEAT repeat protein